MLAIMTQTARTSSGLSLEYMQQGLQGEAPVVFLHGYTDSCRSFSRIFEALPGEIHAIAISLRGHGTSDRPRGPYDIRTMSMDVAALLDFLGYEKITLVGHCMGGFVAQRFALDFPERLDRLVLIDSFATMVDNEDVSALSKEIAGFANGSVDPAFVRAFQESTVAKPVPSEFMDMIIKESMRLPGWTWQSVLSAIGQENLTNELPRIAAPTLLICGEKDALFGLTYQEALLAGLTNAALEVLPGLGHSPHWEDPQAVAQMIVGFACGQISLSNPLELQE